MVITEFTPLPGAIGGALIGLSAVLLLATAGRIAGASFIFGGLFTSRLDENFTWKALFMAGLLAGAAVAGWFAPPQITFPTGTVLTAASGFIVGVGVTLGNGCTSGHGICGLARLSTRSFVAVGVFFVVAILTVTVTGIV